MKQSKLFIAIFLIAGPVINFSLYAQTSESRQMAQYLFPEFTKGTVKFKSGSPISTLMNYNTLSEKVVFQQNGKYLDMINNGNVDTVFMQSKKFIPFDKVYLEVVLDAPIKLFIEHKSDVLEPGRPAAYGGTSQTSSSTRVSTYFSDFGKFNLQLPTDFDIRPSPVYWIKSGEKMEDFLTERQFLKIFPDKEDMLKDFLKKNHIKITNSEDLLKLVYYLNEISR